MMEYFKQNATDANKKKFEALLSSKIVQEIHFYETSIINKDFSKLDPVEWFQKMTAFINDIKLLEDKLLEEISYAVGVNLHKEKRDLILMIITTLMTFMVILFIIYLLQQSSKREILKYTNAIHHLAQGDRSIKLIDVMAKDEMAQMYDAYEKTRQSLLKGDVYTKLYLREKENEIKRKEEETQILQEIAYKDPLTGALNRRKFEEIVRVEFKRAKRYSIKLSFLMMDIDHFKSINDTYGHAVGDEVLKYFVSTYLSMARELDILARIGGEEFVVVLPETDGEGAFAVAERFRKRIEKSCVIVDDKKICFTVSIGIATFDVTKKDQTPETLLEEADKALYEAKKTGRNKTIIAK
ncbi:MAG: diguanylate cyclase [Epsilonproteobacteria bacterium]|nr:diguanylate cyclase [Campylobacterota bacterium]